MVGPELIQFYERGRPFFELTTYFEAPVTVDGVQWPTAEHFYQGLKYKQPELREKIRSCRTAQNATEVARQYTEHLRKDWQADKGMIVAQHYKFSQHPILKQILMSTGRARLVQHSPHDKFWGDGGGDPQGKNYLGRILEKLRDKYGRTRSGTAPAEGSRSVRANTARAAPPPELALTRQDVRAGAHAVTVHGPAMGVLNPGSVKLSRTYSQAFPEDGRPMNLTPGLQVAQSTIQQLFEMLTAPTQQQVLATFSRLDKNGDGVLSGRDWDSQLDHDQSRTRMNQRWKRLRQSMDFDNNGQVDQQEFCVSLVQHAVQEAKIPALSLFSQQDAGVSLAKAINEGVVAACQQILLHYGNSE